MLELKLIETKSGKENDCTFTFKKFSIGNYIVNINESNYSSGCNSTFITINTVSGVSRFIPEIYCNQALFTGEVKGFKIQTTSYGALDIEDTEEVLRYYGEALKVAKILTKEFCK